MFHISDIKKASNDAFFCWANFCCWYFDFFAKQPLLLFCEVFADANSFFVWLLPNKNHFSKMIYSLFYLLCFAIVLHPFVFNILIFIFFHFFFYKMRELFKSFFFNLSYTFSTDIKFCSKFFQGYFFF